MCQKVEQCHIETLRSSLYGGIAHGDDSLHFTLQQCHALNNIIFILQSVHSFPQELGKDDILSKIGEVNGALVAEACKKTIDVLVKNATEDVENQILQVSMFFFTKYEMMATFMICIRYLDCLVRINLP